MKFCFWIYLLLGINTSVFAAEAISANSPKPLDKPDASVIQGQNASGQGQTTIVDEGGSLKIIDANKKNTANQTNAPSQTNTPSQLNTNSNSPNMNSSTNTMSTSTQAPATQSGLAPTQAAPLPPSQNTQQAPLPMQSQSQSVAPDSRTTENANPSRNEIKLSPDSAAQTGAALSGLTPEQLKIIEEMVKAKVKEFQEENKRK